ncbi:hypothetical protein [Sandaracinus amylolyticus]|uniref:hypothetical protein n=1 Tax=Sandaracinus amylolyticus TaxID=927083 RepID=UPI001F3E15E0|nr:hypothetical protein [Sandaracinus amylolyticus]UJR79850.1 Hypothetical protein I5071_18890 [Sandaracinus amylolyticus]
MFINARARQRARAKAKEAERQRTIAKVAQILNAKPGEDLVEVFRKRCEDRRTADAAWSAAERAQQRADVERRLGVLVVAHGELRLYRRAEHAPPNAQRIATHDELSRAIATSRGGRVYGHHNTSAPIDARTLEALAAPMLEAA